MDGADTGDTDSPPRVIARFVVRWSLRANGALPLASPAALLLGGYPPKLSSIAQALRKYGLRAVALSPRVAALGADGVAELLDAKGFAVEHVVPLVDSAVAVADVLNTRLGRPANDPATAIRRRDKFAQQEALHQAGLAAAAQCATADVEAAVRFAARYDRVVVKPRDSSGGDGIWLCASPAEVRSAFAAELGRSNVEDGVNSELVVMEALIGEEWVVNTVSHRQAHRVTDVWRGPPKEHLAEEGGPARFIYDRQFLAAPCREMTAVLAFTYRALDAVGVQNGAAHTELVWVNGEPRLFEVNARCAGGLPRTPHRPNQLEALAMSLCSEKAFLALPQAPEAAEATAVIFLRAPRDCWITAKGLESLATLSTFLRFDRGFLGLASPFTAQRVRRTTGLFSSPGAVVLHGDEVAIRLDGDRVRALEASGYADTAEAEDAPEATAGEDGAADGAEAASQRCCRRAPS